VGLGHERGLERSRSVVAIIIAIQFGLNATLASGAAAYLLALALVTTLRPVSKVA